MRCHFPQPSQWETEPFVELNASLPSRLIPSKRRRRRWDRNYAAAEEPISPDPGRITTWHLLSRREDWLTRAKARISSPWKEGNLFSIFFFPAALPLFPHPPRPPCVDINACVRVFVRPSCAACVSQRIPLDCHGQLIGKIEAISLLSWGSAWRQNRSKGYWSLDREKERHYLQFRNSGLCERKVWKCRKTLIREFLFSFLCTVHQGGAHFFGRSSTLQYMHIGNSLVISFSCLRKHSK